VIPRTARNKTGAFKFIQFLTSWQSTQRLAQRERERCESEGRLYLPAALANRVQFERLVQESVYNNPRMPQTFKQAYRVMHDLLANVRVRPSTPVGQLLWNQHVRAYEAGVNHRYVLEARAANVDEMKLALSRMQEPVQQQLDEVLAPPPPTVVRWTPYLLAYLVLIAIPFIAMYAIYKRRRRSHNYRAAEVRAALLFISPWVIGMAVFLGGPILFSVLISFTRYDVLNEARYVGGANYMELARDPLVFKSVVNTLFMLMRIPLMMIVSLAIALLLNRAVRGIGLYRTAFYMPAIVPMVAASLLWVWLFNPTFGPINQLLAWLFRTPLLARFDLTPPLWLQDPRWSKPALIVMSVWSAGAGMIIWLAGLQSIPQQLYEAASIDGAGAWRRFWNITLPMLSPYVLFNAIIGVIATMQLFAESYIMTAGGPADSTMFYAYYLFRQAFSYFRMGYASALAWMLFVFVLALTVLQLWAGKKWVHYEQA
jgi:multiple sugar transport system permease protein